MSLIIPHGCCIALAVFYLSLPFSETLSAQSLQTLQQTDFVQDAGLRIEPGLSYTWGTSALDFFKDYADVLGGTRREFDTPISGSIRVSRYLDRAHSLGIQTGFTRSTLRENYNYDPVKVAIPLAPAQNITQNISVESIPIMVCYDYYPADRQFTTYLGMAAGLGVSRLQWYEDLTSSSKLGSRVRGLRFDDWVYHLAAEMRTGISLGFDGSTNSALRSGIRLEVSYRFVPVTAQFMQDVARSFAVAPPERLAQRYTIDLGGIGVHVGIMIVLRHTKKPRIAP